MGQLLSKRKTTDDAPACIDNPFAVSGWNKSHCNQIVYGYVRKNSFNSFIPNDLVNFILNYYCFQMENIKLDMCIDFQRNDGKYVCGKVTDIPKSNYNHCFEIEYKDDDNKKKIVWIDKKNAYNKFENFESISIRKSQNKVNCNISSSLKHRDETNNNGDNKLYFIKVKPLNLRASSKDMNLNLWIDSEIDCIDDKSDQIKVSFKSKERDEKYTYWVYLDSSMQVQTSSFDYKIVKHSDYSFRDNEYDNDYDNVGWYRPYSITCDTCGSSRNVKQIWSGHSYCGQCRYEHAVNRRRI